MLFVSADDEYLDGNDNDPYPYLSQNTSFSWYSKNESGDPTRIRRYSTGINNELTSFTDDTGIVKTKRIDY